MGWYYREGEGPRIEDARRAMLDADLTRLRTQLLDDPSVASMLSARGFATSGANLTSGKIPSARITSGGATTAGSGWADATAQGHFNTLRNALITGGAVT